MTTILVTGGAGFIGSHVVDMLVDRGYHALVVDSLATGRLGNVNPSACFTDVDVSDANLSKVFEEHVDISAVIHLAAQTSVSVSWARPIQDLRSNGIGILNLLECCRQHEVGYFLFASSAAVYGDSEHIPIPETAPTSPQSPYALTKHLGEEYVRLYMREFGIRTCVMRFANVYGPRQRNDGEAGVVAIFAEAIKHERKIEIHGDGLQTRDFVYVGDVVDAMGRALERKVGGDFNIGTGTQTSILHLYRIMAGISGIDGQPGFANSRPGDIRTSALNSEKAFRELAWEAQMDLESGLRRTMGAID